MVGRLDRAYATLAEGEPEDVAQNGSGTGTGSGLTLLHRVGGGRFASDAAGGGPCTCCGRDIRASRIIGLGPLPAWQRRLPAQRFAAAEAHARAVEEHRYVARPMAYVRERVHLHASICQARGLPDQARQKLDLVFDFIGETRSDGFLPLAQAFQVELAAKQGDLATADRWATQSDPMCHLRRWVRAATGAAEDPAGTGHVCQPGAGRRVALPAAHVRHIHPQHALFTIEVLASRRCFTTRKGTSQTRSQPWHKP